MRRYPQKRGLDGALRLQKGCVNLWVIASQASCHAAADSPKIARSFRDGPAQFRPSPPCPRVLPVRVYGRLSAGRKLRANSARIRCRSRSRSASRASVAIKHRPDTEHEHDAPHLHPQRQLQRIELWLSAMSRSLRPDRGSCREGAQPSLRSRTSASRVVARQRAACTETGRAPRVTGSVMPALRMCFIGEPAIARACGGRCVPRQGLSRARL
jgi:hypothetical protein